MGQVLAYVKLFLSALALTASVYGVWTAAVGVPEKSRRFAAVLMLLIGSLVTLTIVDFVGERSRIDGLKAKLVSDTNEAFTFERAMQRLGNPNASELQTAIEELIAAGELQTDIKTPEELRVNPMPIRVFW